MKYIKKYENFSKDGIEVDNQSYPEYNQEKNLSSKTYVEQIFSQGMGKCVFDMCSEAGVEVPKNDTDLEKAKELCIDFYSKNPELIKSTEISFKTYPHKGGDGVVRTNNIGGVMSEN